MWGQGLDHWQGWTGWSLKWVGLGQGLMEAGPGLGRGEGEGPGRPRGSYLICAVVG